MKVTAVVSHLLPETGIHELGALANASLLQSMPWFSPLDCETLAVEAGHAIVPERPG